MSNSRNIYFIFLMMIFFKVHEIRSLIGVLQIYEITNVLIKLYTKNFCRSSSSQKLLLLLIEPIYFQTER
jgi:hypothetical protein